MFENIFSVPLYKTNVQSDFKSLAKLALEMRHMDPTGINLSNKGGWQSNAIPVENNVYTLKLSKEIFSEVLLFCDKLRIRSQKQNFRQLWFNINEHKDYNQQHIHLESSITGVYYISVPKNSGRIIFNNPSSTMPCIWNHIEITEYNQYNSGVFTYTPIAGDLLIFPSWLEHYVEQNLSTRQRISLSFDFI